MSLMEVFNQSFSPSEIVFFFPISLSVVQISHRYILFKAAAMIITVRKEIV